MRPRLPMIALLAVAALLLAACDSVNEAAVKAQSYTDETLNDPVLPAGPGGSITVEGFEWGFEILQDTPQAGPVTVNFRNTGGTTHNFRIDAAAGETKKVEALAGEEATGTLQLFAGTYTFYCDIPGHRAQGMEGTITVEPAGG